MTTLEPKKTPQPPSPHPALQQDEKFEGIESSDDDAGAALDIHGYNGTTYKRIDI